MKLSQEENILKKPRVSICIPSYKEPLLLKRAIESVLMQSYADYEIIITDDTPDDSVKNMVNSINSPKIKYFRNTNHKSSTSNWNFAIENSCGEYIKILHHDDWFNYKDSLFKFVNMLDENPDADFAFCVSKNIYSSGELMSYNRPSPKDISKLSKNPYYLFFRNIIGAPSATIYRRKVRHNFDENLIYTVDWDFYMRVLVDNPVFVFSNEDLICITGGAEHQVTAKCMGNKDIHIYDCFYTADKFRNKLGIREIVLLCNLLYQYKIKSKHEVARAIIPNNAAFNTTMFLNKSEKTRCFTKSILKILFSTEGKKFKEISTT